jgi:hypothetical protein
MPKTAKRSSAAATGFPDPDLLTVQDLSAGIDLRTSPSMMKPNRARRLRNWSLQEPGCLVTVPGYTDFSTTSLGSGRCQGGQRVYLAGSTFTLAGFGGSVYKPSDAGVWGAAVLTGLHATNDLFFPHDRDLVAVFDGSNVPKKSTNGTTWTQLGIAPPSAAPTAALVAGGSLTNGSTYEFSYAGQDDELTYEGNESATVQIATTPGNLTVRLTLNRHTDAQVDTLVVYGRDVTAGEGQRRRIGTVANPAGASTTYDVTANTWSTNDEALTDHTVPPALDFGVVWKNRWWARDSAVKNRLRFTQIFESQAWPSLYFIDIPFERGDTIAAVVPSGDTLVVFGYASKPFLVIGQTSLDFEVRPSAQAEAGALGPRAVALIENGIVHAAAEGVYIFDGAADRLLSHDIDVGWRDFVAGATAIALGRVPLVYHRARKELRVAVTRLYPYGTEGEWLLDLNRTRLQEVPAWTSTDRAAGGYVLWDGPEATSGNRGRLFSWSTTVGRLYEEAVGTSANGSDITTDYEGPAFITGFPVARFIELYGEYQPASGSFGLEVIVDGLSVSTPAVSIGSGVALYGSATYGTSTYGSQNRKPFVMLLPLSAEGRSATVRASYIGQSLFRWFSYGLSTVTEALPRGI